LQGFRHRDEKIAHAIVLFDEADALFGKRTAVTSSNDHHATSKCTTCRSASSRLPGLHPDHEPRTTNHDAAFRRRLSVRIRFSRLDADERTMLWRVIAVTVAAVRNRVVALVVEVAPRGFGLHSRHGHAIPKGMFQTAREALSARPRGSALRLRK
jgi:hypothetical protein